MILFHRLAPWIGLSITIAVLDLLLPPWFALCLLQVGLQFAAFRSLAAHRMFPLTISLVVCTILPGFIRTAASFDNVGFIDSGLPWFWTVPVRAWVVIALGGGLLYQSDQLRNRKRRLQLRRQLQRKVRRRSLQISRINNALRREVSRRQATQQRLTRTESHLQSLAHRMQLQVLRKDHEGVITYANDAFCRNIGRSIDEVIGCTDSDLYPRETAQRYRADDLQVMASGIPVDHVEPHPIANGKTSWVQVFKAPDYNEANECIGIQMVFWDVTETYRRTAELKRSEARKRAIFDAAREAILLVDNQGRIVEANPSAESLFCSGSGSIAGCLIETVAQPIGQSSAVDEESAGETKLPAETAGEPLPLDWKHLPTSERREFRVRRHDKTVFPAEVSVHPIPLENSQGVAVFVRDVTLRHQTLQVLQEAKRVAEMASRSKSEFMASVSHEIRTPLGGITGSADLLSRMELPARAHQYVKMIRNSAELLTGVIGDILDFASMEAGKLQIDPVPIDLHDCVGEAFRLLATRAAGKDLELILSIAPDTPRAVLADPQRLRQIVINLAGNAIKFTPTGYVELRLSYRDQLFLIEVVDSGIGIAKELHAKVFEPFEQGDSSTTRKFGGTGLGLSISRKLAIQMGGSLELESVVGMGSTFRCSLPLPVVDSPDTKRALLQNDSAETLVHLAIRHPEQRQAIHSILIAYGYHVTALGDSAGPGLWIADDTAVANRMMLDNKADTAASLTDSPLIWLARAEESEQTIPAHASAVLIKPIAPEDLLRVVKKVIGDRPAQQCLVTPAQQSLVTPAQQSLVTPAQQSLVTNAQEPLVTTAREPQTARSQPTVNGVDLGQDRESETPRDLSHARLLVVDDSEVNRTVIHDFLSLAGYSSDAVPSGAEALRRCAEQPGLYHAILMDLQMPEMDGVETMQQLRAFYESNGSSPPPVIALTAHATKEHERRCLDAGMQCFLCKPVVPEELIDAVDSVLMPPQRAPRPVKVPVAEQTIAAIPVWQTTMLRLAGGNELTMRSLAEAFCTEVPQLCDAIEQAISDENFKELRRAAHTLKSCLRYVAPASDWQVAESLELAGLNEQLSKLEQLKPQVFDIAQRWVNTVSEWLGR